MSTSTPTEIRETATRRVYFAVPDHYTIGREFDTFDAAIEYARSTIVAFEWGASSRAFVDVRVDEKTETGSVDRSLHRTEVFPV